MPGSNRLYWLHLLSPTHVGTGRGLGYIDLPICREKVTGWPFIPGSAFKGVWSDYYRGAEERRRTLAFGRADAPNDGSAGNAGALVPTDARLVCLPVRSFRGTFAWCTSRMALRRLRRDLDLIGQPDPPVLPAEVPDVKAWLGEQSVLKVDGTRVYLEDLDFEAEEGPAEEWARWIARSVFPDADSQPWQDEFARRFAILPDTAFDFLSETGTEVAARVRIDDKTKTVANGQLWYEESLPPETLLAGFVSCDRVYGGDGGLALLDEFAPTSEPLTIQIGGKATTGRGRVRCVFTP